MGTTIPSPIALPPAPPDDLGALARIVKFVGNFLAWLLEQPDFFSYPEDHEALTAEFHSSIRPVVDDLVIQLGRRPTEQQVLALESAGLTGRMLRLKWALLAWDIGRGRIKRVIKRINSILGSLAAAFPPAHAIQEFKDQTEASMGDLEDSEGPQPLPPL